MDNWDYKFQHPVVTRKNVSSLVYSEGFAQGVAADPTVKYSVGRTRADSLNTYSDTSRVIFKLQRGIIVPVSSSLMYCIGDAAPESGLSYSTPTTTAPALAHRITPVTESFDLDDMSWNNIAALATATSFTCGFWNARAQTSIAPPGTQPGVNAGLNSGVIGVDTTGGYTVYGFILDVKINGSASNLISAYAETDIDLGSSGAPTFVLPL